MARLPRLSIAHQLHLLIQRAKADQPVLHDAADCDAYLACLRDASVTHGVAVHAFALTPTDVRLLVTPATDTALGALLQAIGRRFVNPYNRRHGRSGPLWDGRFRATVVEPETCFVDCLRFVETAPVRMGLVESAESWPWSSAAHHAGARRVPGLSEHPQFWRIGNTPFEREAVYRQLLALPLDAAPARRLENAALRGWALGSAAFIDSVSALAKRRLVPLPRGRRPKPRNADVSLNLSPKEGGLVATPGLKGADHG